MPITTPVKNNPTLTKPVSAKAERSKVKTLAVIALWQVLALLATEGVLYWLGIGEEDIYKMDKHIGFMHFPNKRVTWRSEGYSQSYFDADGMRQPGLTINKPDHTFRVGLLGDSMVEGLQVPVEQTFANLVESKFNKNGKQPVQVLNFANSGYSTAQEDLELRSKVFKYKPDLVVLGYMSRDMFENWSPPDQTITNVRPYALDLPGKGLVLDNSPVRTWMRTPRAKFMVGFEFIRHHSRIWGLISALDTQLSAQDPIYRGFMALVTKPGETLHQWQTDLQKTIAHPPSLTQLASMAAPSFAINTFENTQQKRAKFVYSSITHAPRAVPNIKLVTAPQLSPSPAIAHGAKMTAPVKLDKSIPELASAPAIEGAAGKKAFSSGGVKISSEPASQVQSSGTDSPTKSETPKAVSTPMLASTAAASSAGKKEATNTNSATATKAGSGDATKTSELGGKEHHEYVTLMTRTMRSLLLDMRDRCAQQNCKFAVMIVPCRAQLSPTTGMQTEFYNMTYNDEIAIMKTLCEEEKIPMFNGETAAESVPPAERPSMFYLMHMNAKGHQFFADALYPFLQEQVAGTDR